MENSKDEKTLKKQSVYERLSKINVSKYLKDIKNTYQDKYGNEHSFSLKYLSWARAWGLVKAIYPDATYKIREYPNWVQTADGTFQQAGTLDYRITSVGCEVEVTVTINNVNYTQKLYPMSAKNEPIMKPNIKDINKAQLRCLVKALATAGLGLDVYAGEDLPSNEDETDKKKNKHETKKTPKRDVNEAGLKVIWNAYIQDHSEKAKKWITGPHDPATAKEINKLFIEYKREQGKKDLKEDKTKQQTDDETIKELVDGKPKSKEDPFKDQKEDTQETSQQQDLFNDIVGG